MPAGQKPAAHARHVLGWLLTPPQSPPFRPGTFRSRTCDPTPAAWLGIALGVAFGVCFVTGMLSHLVQSGGSLLAHDVISGGGWRAWPTAGGQLYRVTQGLHVTTGIAAVPLLFAKLFVVYPHLFTWPPVRGVRHAVERITLPLLVGGNILMLLTGVQNVMYWYPWRFFFVGHYSARVGDHQRPARPRRCEGVDHRGRRPSGTAKRHRRCRRGDRRCRRGS